MVRRPMPTQAVAIAQDRNWAIARRIFCLFAVAMTGYFAFILTWVALNPAI